MTPASSMLHHRERQLMARSMSFPFDISRLLVAAPVGRRLRVVSILFEATRQRCATSGVVEGSELTCLAIGHDHVLLDVAGRGPMRLPLSLAVCVEVEIVASGVGLPAGEAIRAPSLDHPASTPRRTT